ncbi:DUF5460 family protein [Rickettsia felis]|uniref:DUF5460 family protein n=1 Tax=Rickettsia felis TaxID=42862 RepID=UPI000575326C|nr:DUF5460 family protein [Rickettsia felis]KHO02659.1 tRNA modification GTPase TrmE [Rickettsia felis]MDE8611582.1 DUF5460 family protein [Rickettsia felis]
MAPVLNINFKCVMPIFGNEMVSSLPGNVSHIIHKLSGTIFSSVYSTVEGAFKKGYMVNNAQCNWKNIEQSFSESPNDFSILHQECNNGLNTPINNIFTDAESNPHILLQQTVTPHQNGTANILGQLYKVTNDYMFSQGDITETNGADFLGLNECTKKEAISALQNYNTYKKQLTSIETLTNILQDTLNHLGISQDNAQEVGVKIFDVLKIPVKFTTDNLRVILNAFKITLDNAQEAGVKTFDVLKIPVKFTTDNLKIILEAFNVTLDDISPTEIGKNILDLLSKPFTETTTSTTERTNDDTNDGGYSGAYIAGVALGTLAIGTLLGYAAKYGWDWYKGRNIKNENLEIEGENIKLEGENIKLQKDNLNFKTLIEFQAILDEIIEIGNLTDILAILSKTNQDTINLHDQDYNISPLKLKIQGLDTAITKLNSVSNICTNINSLGNTLHKICELLNGKDTFISIKSFVNLIKELRKTDIKSEEHKNCLEKIFETLLGIDETSSGEYTYIPEEELQNHEMPLLADVSSNSSGIGV